MRKLSEEQKQKMQAGRLAAKAQKAAAPNGQTAPGTIPVFKSAKPKAGKAIIGKLRISRTTLISTLPAVVETAIAEMKLAGLNPVRVGGTLRVY